MSLQCFTITTDKFPPHDKTFDRLPVDNNSVSNSKTSYMTINIKFKMRRISSRTHFKLTSKVGLTQIVTAPDPRVIECLES